MSRILLTYFSATLRQEDVMLVSPGNWLNDQVILFYFEYLTNNYRRDDCLLIDPCTAFVLLIEDDLEDLQDSLNQLDFSRKKFVIFPVNDHSDRGTRGGSHWTLLVIDIQVGTAYYYDGMNGSGKNKSNALDILEKFSAFLRIDVPNLEVIRIKYPQNNSCDCGVYVLMIAEQVYRELDARLTQQDRINPGEALELRDKIAKLIRSLM